MASKKLVIADKNYWLKIFDFVSRIIIALIVFAGVPFTCFYILFLAPNMGKFFVFVVFIIFWVLMNRDKLFEVI